MTDSNPSISDFDGSLSGLDPTVLEQMRSFLENHSTYEDQAFGRKYSDFNTNPEKLLPCEHEIVFSITANVLELEEAEKQPQNDDAPINKDKVTTRSKEICTKNYHIPVPADKDYNVYMTAFFQFLEESLINAAKQATKD